MFFEKYNFAKTDYRNLQNVFHVAWKKVDTKKAFDPSRARRSVPHHISVQNQVAFLRKDARHKTQKIIILCQWGYTGKKM